MYYVLQLDMQRTQMELVAQVSMLTTETRLMNSRMTAMEAFMKTALRPPMPGYTQGKIKNHHSKGYILVCLGRGACF